MNALSNKVNTPLKGWEDSRFEVYKQPKRHLTFTQDALAGLIVALVTIPLGIGFSIASGLKPEQGIIAGAVAGILGGVFGGSKYQIYGPTAAFIPLLSSIVSQHGVPFLTLASVIAGLLIMMMGLLKWGRYFAKVPFSVTVGFTIGIALSISLGQLPDTLGSLQPLSTHTLEKLQLIGMLLTHPNMTTLFLAILTFIIIKYCYKISVFFPGPLIAILVAVLLDQTLLSHQIIPLVSEKFGPMGHEIFKITLLTMGPYPGWALVIPVLSIVFIASLESLLSARMADRLAENKTPYNPDRELIGQGIVNAVVPLLNGFPCTGAFARTATSIKAGATSPVASIINGACVLILMVFFAKYIAMIPMACISGLLLYVACSMVKVSEVRHVFTEGKLHTFLMLYTAIVTFLTDLFIAVSSATAIYYLFLYLKKRHTLPILLGLSLLFAGIQTAQANSEISPIQQQGSDPLHTLMDGNQRFLHNHPLLSSPNT